MDLAIDHRRTHEMIGNGNSFTARGLTPAAMWQMKNHFASILTVLAASLAFAGEQNWNVAPSNPHAFYEEGAVLPQYVREVKPERYIGAEKLLGDNRFIEVSSRSAIDLDSSAGNFRHRVPGHFYVAKAFRFGTRFQGKFYEHKNEIFIVDFTLGASEPQRTIILFWMPKGMSSVYADAGSAL